MTQKGDLTAANRLLRAPSPTAAKILDARCKGDILMNMAVVLSDLGDWQAAEGSANTAVRILENAYPANHEILIRPLHRLALSRFQLGQMARARETLQRLQLIPVRAPGDRALAPSVSAVLLQAEGRLDEAEVAFRETLAFWKNAGQADTADCGSILLAFGSLLTRQGKLDDASRELDRALAIFKAAQDTRPSDMIQVLYLRAAVYAQQKKWRAAKEDGEQAISLADRNGIVNPTWLSALLGNQAVVLRKNHKRKQAHQIETRLAALGVLPAQSTVVDVSELAPVQARRTSKTYQ